MLLSFSCDLSSSSPSSSSSSSSLLLPESKKMAWNRSMGGRGLSSSASASSAEVFVMFSYYILEIKRDEYVVTSISNHAKSTFFQSGILFYQNIHDRNTAMPSIQFYMYIMYFLVFHGRSSTGGKRIACCSCVCFTLIRIAIDFKIKLVMEEIKQYNPFISF